MIIKQDIVEVNRAMLLSLDSTPTFVKNWFKICDNHDPVKLANCAQVFADILAKEAEAIPTQTL